MRAILITAVLMLVGMAAGYAYLDAGCVRDSVGNCSFTLGTMG